MEMEEENWKCLSQHVKSPEIVEIGEDSISFTSSRGRGANDVYVAVGRNDLDVLKWALDHFVSPGSRFFLIHVFPPITYISTPVGRLSKSQLNQDQVRVYLNEENNRRRNLLQKYIRLCTDAKVTVDTLLIESNSTAKAILDLIPVLNITNLVMGTKRSPSSGWLRKKMETGKFVQTNAPEYCEVTVVFEGKQFRHGQQVRDMVDSSMETTGQKPEITQNSSERNFFECVCFSGRFN